MEADLIDALIVGMDMLIKKEFKKYQKRIFLVTDAGCPINKEDLSIVQEQFSKINIRLNIIGINFDEEDENKSKNFSNKSNIKIENENMLKQMINSVGGVIVPIHEAIEMMSYFRSKGVLQRTTFRGVLEISPHLKIPIWSYVKTMEQKFPRFEKISSISQQSANPGNMKVVKETTYHNINDPDNEVPSNEKIKGYKYGKTLVPFSSIDEQVLSYKAEKCLKLIGFTKSKKVPRFYFMGNTECMVPPPGDQNAAIAFSSLVHALLETDSVAIVRYVKRANSVPYLGVLCPLIFFFFCFIIFLNNF
jgi:ATP-dependent DNA helicase 2 subunit 2